MLFRSPMTKIIFLFVEDVLVLYGQRANVDMHNMECLAKHPGDYMTYNSKDSPQAASSRLFDKLLAEKVIQHCWPLLQFPQNMIGHDWGLGEIF